MDQTSQIKQEEKTRYDQIQAEKSKRDSSSTRKNAEARNSTSKRDLTSQGTNESSRNSDSQTVVSRDSIERANIAYQLSFSVPIKGRYPINPNCKS